jgi:hypothetical protein
MKPAFRSRPPASQAVPDLQNEGNNITSVLSSYGTSETYLLRRLKRGQFLRWIEREFAWSEWTARRFMLVHEHVKSSKLHDLEIDVSALYLIAAPAKAPATSRPLRHQPHPARQRRLEQPLEAFDPLGHVLVWLRVCAGDRRRQFADS